MKNIILDASPTIFIGKAGLIKEFRKLGRNFYVTTHIMSEINYPIVHGIKAPEVDALMNAKFLTVKDLDAKEILKAKEIAKNNNIGLGEAEAGVLWKRGGFDVVIVADVRALRMLRNLRVKAIDVVDVGFILAEKGVINPMDFCRKLYDKAHYRTARIREILGRYF